MVVAVVWVGYNGELRAKGYTLQVVRCIYSGDLMYSTVVIVNNAVLYTWKLLRVDLKCLHHKKEMVIMWGDGDFS